MPTTPVCTIDATGIHIPDFQGVTLPYFENTYLGIYGSDVDLDNALQDGQFIGLLSTAFQECCGMAEAVYNSFSPATGQGVGLSLNVKINGLQRGVPTLSTADLVIVGQAGVTITNGFVTDENGISWQVPTVTIPPAGQITVTASTLVPGDQPAIAGSAAVISTPTRGWQSATFGTNSTPGQPVETDATLRIRQSQSTMLPSQSILDGIKGAILKVSGVQRLAAYENDTLDYDANGVPPRSIAAVVEGGDAMAVASAIALKKVPGGSTYGTTTETITDGAGIPHPINFFRPTLVPINFDLTLRAKFGFNAVIEAEVQQSLSDWINDLGIGCGEASGALIEVSATTVPLKLYGGPGSKTFELVARSFARDGGPPQFLDIPIAFNERPTCTPDAIVITVTS